MHFKLRHYQRRFYTEDELVLVRAQLQEGNRLAMEAVRRLGVQVHPRIARLHEEMAKARADAAAGKEGGEG